MIFDMNNQESQALLTQWKAATKAEELLRIEFDALINSGKANTSIAKELQDRMTVAHNKAMDILDQLQNHRLDE